MKIFKDHDKMHKHFEAVERMQKRYISIFAFFGFVLCGVSIYFFVNNAIKLGIGLIIFSIMMFITSGIRYYMYNIVPKKNPAYPSVVVDYKNNKIKKELSKRGLKLDNIDIIADPNGAIKIGYSYNKNTYYLAKIGLGEYGFGVDITESMLLINVTTFDKHLPKGSYGKISSIKTKGKTKEDFYDSYAKYIKNNNEEIEKLDVRCRDALNEHQKTFQ